MAKIPGGCILLARKVIISQIWDKPPWWFKVWFYLISEVNYVDNKPHQNYKKGQGFFSLESIKKECHLHGITVRSVQHPIRWLKAGNQIRTRKVTHGMIITVCNYNTYQDLTNYKSDKECDSKCDGRVMAVGQTCDTPIDNSLKKKGGNAPNNIRIEELKNKNTYVSFFNSLWKRYPERNGLKRGRKKALDFFLANFLSEKFPLIERAVKNYANCGDIKRGLSPMDMSRFLGQRGDGKRPIANAPWIEFAEAGNGDGARIENQREIEALRDWKYYLSVNAGGTEAERAKLKAALSKEHSVGMEIFK